MTQTEAFEYCKTHCLGQLVQITTAEKFRLLRDYIDKNHGKCVNQCSTSTFHTCCPGLCCGIQFLQIEFMLNSTLSWRKSYILLISTNAPLGKHLTTFYDKYNYDTAHRKLTFDTHNYIYKLQTNLITKGTKGYMDVFTSNCLIKCCC